MDDQAVIRTYGNTNLPEGTPDRPLVTFALFAYNQEKYIREAVEGAFSQTYSPLEIILSDDCSSDRTLTIIEEMAVAYRGQHRVLVHRTPTNFGRMTFGRRVWSLLSLCKGELIVLAAGDDVSIPSRTESLFEVWNESGRGAVCIHSKALLVDTSGIRFGSEIGANQIAEFSIENFIIRDGRGLLGATNAVSKKLLSKFSPFPDVMLIEDGALAFRAKLSDGILFVPYPLVLYRRHSTNLSGQAELRNSDALNAYIRGLIGQHSCYLSDYISVTESIDSKIISASLKRLQIALQLSKLYDGNLWQRLVASFLYSRWLPYKSRLRMALSIILQACFAKRNDANS